MDKSSKPSRARTSGTGSVKSETATAAQAKSSRTRRTTKPTGEPTVTAKAPPKPRTRKKASATQPPSHEQISLRAYFLWEAAGRPEGKADVFWHTAERELMADR